MTSSNTENRLLKLETALSSNRFDRMSEAELDEQINQGLVTVCEGYPSVNAAADAFRGSNDLVDRQLAERLDWYIGYVAEERAAGRMN